MAFDGITVSCLRKELSDKLTGGRITKIVQSEADELLLTIKNNANQYRLLLSASASLPLAYLTDRNKPAPMTAPGFCMLLRKHLGGGRIVAVTQPSLERILHFHIEHLDEMGDLCRKTLIVELMGKHSNLIFCREDGMILDSIKHVSLAVSSVREVLPGRTYFIPHTQDKLDPLTVAPVEMVSAICEKPTPLSKAIYTTLTGFSPVMAEELCHRASVESARPAGALTAPEREMLSHQLLRLMETVKDGDFEPRIYYRNAGSVSTDTAFSTVRTESGAGRVLRCSADHVRGSDRPGLRIHFCTAGKLLRHKEYPDPHPPEVLGSPPHRADCPGPEPQEIRSAEPTAGRYGKAGKVSRSGEN